MTDIYCTEDMDHYEWAHRELWLREMEHTTLDSRQRRHEQDKRRWKVGLTRAQARELLQRAAEEMRAA